ncbi:acyl-CoA dehydrogenase family protein [Mycobacterium paraffinicum]|uniref:acyl-CoA dehydrogenase family protein n=1 Tax=Mycobacterium paraffinicum TaxID=53378 RepID=UPI00093A9AA7|nr:acyl-CoA dehydrogenase family protein [Mycobacterium paraffinicum]
MDFNDTTEQVAFRRRLRKWLRECAGEGQLARHGVRSEEAQNSWHRDLYSAGYIGLSLPVDDGGRGLPLTFEATLHEEIGRVGAPSITGVSNLIHALHRCGSDRQRAELRPGLISGSVRWCIASQNTRAPASRS